MTTAVYRGISYNVEDRKYNDLLLVKQQLEKELSRREAEKANIRLAHKN